MTRYISLLIVILLGCSRVENQSSDVVVSIASLRGYDTSQRAMLITDHIAIEGKVVGNDCYGEFYNCLMLDDGTAAIKIICDVDDNYQLYPFGSSVRLYCSGLYLINHYGPLSIGAEPTGDYTLDYIDSSKIGQYLKGMEDEEQLPDPLITTIPKLTPLQSYRYIELQDITIIDTLDIGKFCARDSLTGRTIDTSHTLIDRNGNTMELYVESECRYGDASLPSEEITIQLIVDYYDGEYLGRITNCGY